jgi:hypothetical protein
MRKTLLLIPLLALAGCAGPATTPGVATANGGATPTASGASPSSGSKDGDQLKFAQCMRDNGMTWFKDPEPDQRGVRISPPEGTDDKKVDAAMNACKQYMPNGGEPGTMDPKMQAQLRVFSKCMRENGIPEFPDPSADGGIQVKEGELSFEPDSPEFKKAEQACSKFQPSPPPGGGQKHTENN